MNAPSVFSSCALNRAYHLGGLARRHGEPADFGGRRGRETPGLVAPWESVGFMTGVILSTVSGGEQGQKMESVVLPENPPLNGGDFEHDKIMRPA